MSSKAESRRAEGVRRARPERRLSTPLVLALSSAMISIGVVAFLSATRSNETSRKLPTSDVSTPERASETFLDAYRKRQHDVALAMSEGSARKAVLERKAKDEELPPDERRTNQRVWDLLASNRLDLHVRESEELGGGRVTLRGIAEGTFMGEPYRRAMTFVLRPDGTAWKVVEVDFGDILSDVARRIAASEGSGEDAGQAKEAAAPLVAPTEDRR